MEDNTENNFAKKFTEENKQDMDVSDSQYSDQEVQKFLTNLPNIVDKNFIILKAIEELGELSVALTQLLTKPNYERNKDNVAVEMADTGIWLYQIAELLKISSHQQNTISHHKVCKLIALSKSIKDWGKI